MRRRVIGGGTSLHHLHPQNGVKEQVSNPEHFLVLAGASEDWCGARPAADLRQLTLGIDGVEWTECGVRPGKTPKPSVVLLSL